MKRLVVLALLCAGVFSGGCATIVTGGKQKLTFNSEPPDATISVAGMPLGKTPLTTEIDRDKNLSLTFEKEGYKTYTTRLTTTLNGWFWGNIIFGGLVGSTTDAVSGSMHEYAPSQYYVTLVSEKPFGVETDTPRSLRQLVVGFGPDLRAQLAAGAGPVLEQVLSLAKVTEESRAEAIAALKALATSTPDDLALANKIIQVYSVK